MKKELIRQAAISVIAREGFHSATTDRIARKAGIAVGTIYNYFKDKEEILDYIFQVEYEKRAEFFKKLQEKSIQPLEKIRLILKMHFEELKENPDLVKVILEERKLSRRYYLSETRNNGLRGFLEKILQEGIAQGKVRECDPGIVSTILFGAIEGLMAQYLQDLESKNEPICFSGAVAEMMELINRGLRAG